MKRLICIHGISPKTKCRKCKQEYDKEYNRNQRKCDKKQCRLRCNKWYKTHKDYKTKYYKAILDALRKGSKDYQLLCANCNWIKRSENKEALQPKITQTL